MEFFSISDKNENDINLIFDNLIENFKKGERSNINDINNDSQSIKIEYNVHFIGKCGVGAKTSLISALMNEEFTFCTEKMSFN